MTITPDQKAEWAEAREQATAAIARLNDLYAAPGRRYRARVTTYWALSPAELDGEPAGPDLDDLDDDAAGDLSDDLGDLDQPRAGSEHAEREDESADEI